MKNPIPEGITTVLDELVTVMSEEMDYTKEEAAMCIAATCIIKYSTKKKRSAKNLENEDINVKIEINDFPFSPE